MISDNRFSLSSKHYFGELSEPSGQPSARANEVDEGDGRLSSIEDRAEYFYLGGNTILNLKRHPRLTRELYQKLTQVRPPCIFAEQVRFDPQAKVTGKNPFDIGITPLPCLMDSVVGPARAMLVSLTLPAKPEYCFFEMSMETKECLVTRQFFLDQKGRGEFVAYFPETDEPTEMEFSVRGLNSMTKVCESLTVQPCPHITFHLMFATHVDIGWTSRPAEAIRALEEMTARDAIEICDAFPLDSDLPFRWFCEGHWSFEVAYQAATDEQKSRLEELLRNGQIQVGGLPYTPHSHLGMGESLLHFVSARPTTLHRLGIQPRTGLLVDVPGATACLPEVCSQAGMTNFFLGANSMMKAPQLPSLFNWVAPSGARVLTYFCTTANIAVASNFISQGPLFTEQLLHSPMVKEFPTLDRLLLRRTYGENVGPIHAAKEMQDYLSWNQKFLWPRFECGGLDDYFDHVRSLDLDLQELQGDINDWWIEGVASYPNAQARFREIARQAPVLQTASGLLGENPDMDPVYDDLNMHMEHTFGMNAISVQGRIHHLGETLADFPTFEASWEDKEAYTLNAARKLDDVKCSVQQHMEEMGGEGSEGIIVFNPSASRQALEVTVDLPADGVWHCSIIDSEGCVVARGLGRHGLCSFLTPLLPPLSFSSFQLERAELSSSTRGTPSFRSDGLSLVMDTERGGIRSLKGRSGREWIDASSPYAFSGLTHTLWGATIPDEFSGFQPDHPEQGEHRPILKSTEVEEDAGVFKAVQRFEGSGEDGAFAEYTLEVTAWADQSRVRLSLSMTHKQATAAGESFSLNFPLSVTQPEWNYDNGLSRLRFRESGLTGGNDVDCAVSSYLECVEAGEKLVVVPHESFLFQPGEKRAFSRDVEPNEPVGLLRGMLLNNVWQTNFRIWHRDDSQFTFDLFVEDPRPAWTLAQSVLTKPPAVYLPACPEIVPSPPIVLDGEHVVTLSCAVEKGGYQLRLWEASGQDPCKAVIHLHENGVTETLTITYLDGRVLDSRICTLDAHTVELSFLPNEVLTLHVEVNP